MTTANTSPNILIIHCDQLRNDALGCHGHPGNPTPHLDELASKGLDFSRHITANPVCMPSRASFFTGLHVTTHGVWINGVALNRAEYLSFGRSPYASADDALICFPTIADQLAEAGYRTGAFGKLHLTPTVDTPAASFPESDAAWAAREGEDWQGPYYGFEHVELTHAHGENAGGHFDLWLKREHPEIHRQVAENGGPDCRPVEGIGDLYPSVLTEDTHPSLWLARRAGDWIEAEGDQPFFAFVGFPDPHHAFIPLQEDLEYFEGVEMLPPVDPDGSEGPDLEGCGTDVRSLSPEEQQTIRRYTAAMVRTIDRAVGALIERLKASGQWENTVVLFTSDHGDYLGDHGALRKSARVTRSLVEVPCILRLPDDAQPSAPRLNSATGNVDILPTLLELAGAEAIPFTHGLSLLAEECLPAFTFSFGIRPDEANFTLVDDRYRYTTFPHRGVEELFDQLEDPGECRNLVDKMPDKAQAYRQALGQAQLRYTLPTVGRVASW